MASGSLSLEGIRAACDDLGSISRALAGEHSVALIVGSDGALSFTALGSRVISEAPHPHPLHKTIARACHAHHARTGGDCKAVLAMLGEALRLTARLARELGDDCARRTLLAELSRFDLLLPDLFQGVREAVGIVSDPADPAAFSERLADVVRSRSMSSGIVVSEFVRGSVSDFSASPEALDYFVDRFEDLCSRAVSGVNASAVLKGFLLNASADCPWTLTDLRFVVVWDLSVKMDDVIWVDAVSLSGIWPRIEATLSGLKDHRVSAILTPSAAPSRLHACCSRLGISLVDRLSPGDLRNVLFFTGVIPLDTLNDPIEEISISQFNSMRSVVFGGTRFLHLETSVTVRPFLPHHIVLCAPSPTVWKEQYAEFLDCLKVLRQWLCPSSFQKSVDRTEILQDPSPKLVDRTKILQDPSPKSVDSTQILRDPSPESNQAPSWVVGLSFPLGLWELELKLALPKAENSCPNLCRVLDGALLATLCGTWGIPVYRYKGRDSYKEYASRNGAKGFAPIVPAATAESVLTEVLQLMRQLLRIDAIVGSKDALSGTILANQKSPSEL